jgi:hypothetical protein
LIDFKEYKKMAVKDRVFKGKIKQKGIYDYKAFYEFVYDYLSEEEYDVHESLYHDTVKGDAKDLNIKWSATKIISDYFQFEITLNWIILGQKKIKLNRDGREVSMDSGTLEINFEATLIKDHENKWNSGFLKVLRDIYDEYIIRSRIDDYEVQLFEEMNEIIATIKSYLAIEGQHTV